ncbi:MerR family transcriptional regulator [Pengzhenrongella phosphoraccumulans]|uniref:MerR family transcriptional regulator n=1 Tax=Pengzhenrongella phosphoraccumulans TaxID=3114394 RepID=UPI00388EFC37
MNGTWQIGELARLSGVTSRTLRHYDAIGLLEPRDVGPGGRRAYGRDELLRLQQILVLRELDVPLATVADMLSGELLERLREHHERLLTERDRFDRLARTVATTITALTKGEDMAADKLYEGFDNSAYDAEARERWGEDPVDRGNAAWERLGPAGQAAHHAETAAINAGLAAAMAEGAASGDARVQALVARHFAQISIFWTPTAAAYEGLGQMYVDDERFAATYDAVAPGLPAYLHEAMTVYARTALR